MSINDEIARLTGSLVFKVDSSGLQRFLGMLKSAEVAMAKVGRQADSLSARMSKSLGLKVDTKGREKLDKQLRTSLDRELRGELLVQRARRATLTAELAGQKLQFTGQKAAAFLSNAAIRDKQAMAVLSAKQQAAETVKLKTQNQALKNEDQLVQAKARQVRAEAILATQRQRTLNLQAAQQRTMTATQRIEAAMVEGRARGQRAAIRFAETQAAQKVRAQRQDVAFQQRTERHAAFQARQVQWVANQDKPPRSTGFLGLGTGALAVGGAAAGVAAIVGAISALGARMSAVQDRVSDSQSWANTVEQAAGQNPANKEFAKAEFLRITDKYGTSADVDAAKEYRTFLLHQMAVGKSISQSTKMYETQMAAFRGAGMSKTEMQRANIQLTQVRAKGKGDTEDVNTFSEAAPLLVAPIKQAWAERNNHKLDENLEKDFRASFKVGNLKAVDFERGLEIFNRDNKPAIEKQSSSIDSNATRLANKQFLQQQGLDQSPQLIDSINERLKSEMELNEAMKPLKETAVQLDIALNKLVTSTLRLSLGRNADGTERTEAQQLQARMSTNDLSVDTAMTGIGDYSKVDARTQHQGGWIGELYNKLFNVKDYRANTTDSRARWNDVGWDEKSAPWSPTPPPLNLDTLNTKGLQNYGKRLEDLLSQSDPNSAVARVAAQAVTNASRGAPGSRGAMSADEPRAAKSEPVVNNITNNTPVNVEVNITAKTDASASDISNAVSGQVRTEVQKVFQEYQPKEIQ